MANIIKTSDSNWLIKVSTLYYSRSNFNVLDDSKLGLEYISDKVGLYKKTTLKTSQLLFVAVIYLLALCCGFLIFVSFSLGEDKLLGIILSLIGLIVFAFVPTYYLLKNKAPIVEQNEDGFKIRF